jgi:D-glycero-beta-D-manno-heptose-7-phosphate kinase
MSEFLLNIFDSFNKQNVLIIGDVMIDSYLIGKVDRISPEAPVPILNVLKRENRLGGAANVALNVKALGATPILCSAIGMDAHQELFFNLLKESDLSSEGIICSKDRITTVKTRLIGQHQHLFRVDDEDDRLVTEQLTDLLIQKIKDIINSKEISIIIFEDYDKGVITQKLIEEIITTSNMKNIPVVVDPKKRNFLSYKNVQLFKPNIKELKEGLKIDFDHYNHQQLIDAAKSLKAKLNADMVMITLSEQGILMLNNDEAKVCAAHIRSISDVAGAGDTVISVAALGLAAGLSPMQFTELANLAGGLVCEKVGVVPIDKNELLNEALLLENI